MRRVALLLTLAFVLASCKIVTTAGGGASAPADGLDATAISIPGAPAIGALIGVNVALHPAGGIVFSSDGRVVRIVGGVVEVLYDERDAGAPVSGVFARPAVNRMARSSFR